MSNPTAELQTLWPTLSQDQQALVLTLGFKATERVPSTSSLGISSQDDTVQSALWLCSELDDWTRADFAELACRDHPNLMPPKIASAIQNCRVILTNHSGRNIPDRALMALFIAEEEFGLDAVKVRTVTTILADHNISAPNLSTTFDKLTEGTPAYVERLENDGPKEKQFHLTPAGRKRIINMPKYM